MVYGTQITVVNGVYKPTYGHLEGTLIYHRVDVPLPCLIIRSQMAQEKTWCCC